ncbi:hypothetical protein ACKAV7_000014 [Fusarium commune]
MGSIQNQPLPGKSCLSRLQPLPLDPVFALDAAFKLDNDSRKVNLGIGVYRDDDGQAMLLSSVREAKKQLDLIDSTHEYLPLHGSDGFLENTRKLIFGSQQVGNLGEALTSIQTVSGSGANSLIARFLRVSYKPSTIWLPDPTWDNHVQIWQEFAPDCTQRRYPYYDPTVCGFDFNRMTQHLKQHAQQGDAILFHACAHNPTGSDPTLEQWEDISFLCQQKGLFVIFDLAYQGFASGDPVQDSSAIRHFSTIPNIELAVCQSFSKNLGLYGERAGALHVLASRVSAACISPAGIKSHLVALQRADFSMPPRFGVSVVEKVLSDPELFNMWIADLAVMSGRIKNMRQELYEELVALKTPGQWKHIIEQKGMFCYTGLSKEQVLRLKTDFHVYLLESGRISIAGLRGSNVRYVARAIRNVVTDASEDQNTQ